MNSYRVGIKCGRRLSAAFVVMVLFGASAIAYAAKSCYCNSNGPISACTYFVFGCHSADDPCSYDAGGSDQIWLVSIATEKGKAGVAAGALGTCRYYTGTCSYGVPHICIADDSGLKTTGIQSSTATGDDCYNPCTPPN